MPETAAWSTRAQGARARLAAGDIAAARDAAAAIVASAQSDAERAAALLVLASCCEKSGDALGALANARKALGCVPEDPLAHYAYAELQESAGDKAGAVESLRRAIAIDPRFAPGLRYLGILLGEGGEAEGAVDALKRALAIEPGHARAWNNLGNAQRTLGRLEEAERSFARALSLKPDYALAAANLGEVQRDQGEAVRAEATLRDALARERGAPFRPLVVLLAGLLRERGALDESARLYGQAIELAPREAGSEWFNLGWILTARGEPQEARKAYAAARGVDPGDLRSLFGQHLTLPMIYADGAELSSARAAYAEGLAALERELPAAARSLPEARILDGLRWSNFFLAYQGRDDRSLQEAYAALVADCIASAAPDWHRSSSPPPRGDARLRVGFASAFFHDGTCGRYFRSWVTDLERRRFEVFVYHLFPGMDEVANALAARADRFRTFGGNRARPSVVAPIIRDDALDVLVYPELGMDACSFGLAALRLAPRQYAGWGHPVTTGHPTIDGFISCEAMEPTGAEAHYTETLVKLPGIGTRYEAPAVPHDVDRAQFSLPEDRTLLLCPQSLWKIHPDNDSLFAEILGAHSNALLILFAGRHPALTDRFMRRLERGFAAHGVDVRERVKVLPQVGHDDYLRINRACDVMLDTLHWSGGNTSLDALACGLPIVTLPGAYMRGRQSAGMLGLMDVPELVARDRADYRAIAGRLVGDDAWRRAISERIRSGQRKLFGFPAAIEALEKLFQTGTA